MTRAPHGATRSRVLTAIRTAATPPTIDELATELALHRNSVRQHIAGLHDAGLIVRTSRSSGGRGRPLSAYLPTSRGTRAGGRDYRLLAEVLVEHIASTAADSERAARDAGRTWGHKLAADRDDAAPVPAVLDELGFEPACSAGSIELRNCPFRELVDSHPGLICALHAGMLEGLTDGRPETATLIPFATPVTCRVSLTAR